MITGNRENLLQHLDESHQMIEDLLPKIDPEKEIYPGWTIKQILAHIIGWDNVSIDVLQAHVSGCQYSTPAIHSLDKYNESVVSSRKELSYEQILMDWRQIRNVLCKFIEQVPEDKFKESVAVPWGKSSTITRIVDIFSSHELEHAMDIKEWLKQPEKPLGKAGK